jgi:hypothetical protein
MIGRKEIARRFLKWLEGQGDTLTMEDVVNGFEEMFPEVDDEGEANAIMKFLDKALRTPPRKPLNESEIRRRRDRFIASKPVGSEFTIEEMVAAIFPELDEAAAREEAYALAKERGWEGDPWFKKIR